jgi:hypothetical protein
MIPIARPNTSPCENPSPNRGLALHELAWNVVTASKRRCIKTSIGMMTYSAIANDHGLHVGGDGAQLLLDAVAAQ